MSDSSSQDGQFLPATIPNDDLSEIGRLTELAIKQTIDRSVGQEKELAAARKAELTEARKKELAEAREKELEEARDMASQAIAEVYREIFRQTAENQFLIGQDRINSQLIDRAIERLDEQIGAQLDAVMHHPKVQELESSWRSLRYLAERSPLSSNVKISLLTTTEDQLDDDLESQRAEKSGFFNHVYSAELGSFGGSPYGAIVTTFAFGPQPRSMRLLRNMAACASMAHAPLLASATPQMLGVDDLRDLAGHGDEIRGAQGANPKAMREWESFRRSPDSRYVALTVPRMMLRLPYGPDTLPVRGFNYQEASAGTPENYLWGSSAFALAAAMSRSFKENRWFNRIVGIKSGGLVDRLPMHAYRDDGVQELACPTEIFLNDNQEKTLASLGFTALTMNRSENNAVFFGAQSAYDPSHEAQGDEADALKANRSLQAGLPYTLIVTRVSHYLKGMMRNYLGMQSPNKEPLQKVVNDWIKGYCLRNEKADGPELLLRPLKDATVTVEDWPGRPGYYKFNVLIKPHFHFAGADISIGLDGFVNQDTQR